MITPSTVLPGGDNRPLRVGVNLLWLVPGVVGGSENYITRLLHGVARAAPPDVEIVLFTLRQFPAVHSELAAQFTTVVAPIDGSNKPLRIAAESTWLARAVRRHHIDVMHHAGGRVPLVGRTRSVVTIHDLQPLDMPENFSVVKRRFLRRALPQSAARATIVAAPSEFVRGRVIELLRVPRERTAVVAAPLRERAEVSTTIATAAVEEVLDSGNPFFVYPAITYRHKNHAVLLEAFARTQLANPDVRLVLTGGEGPEEATIRSVIASLGLAGSVVRTGRVPRGDLDALIERSVAVVFPSRYEGFGLPVLEAMAEGRPIIAADAAALPEVVDGVGTLVGPDDVAGWAGAMTSALALTEDEAATRADAERARAAQFSSERSVAALLDAYRRAAPNPP